MGLFDFLKGSGHKVFSQEAEANEKIEQHILANNPGIDHLKVDFKKSVAHLAGEARTPEALQKAVLMAGNIEGVESVDISRVKMPRQVQAPKDLETFQETQFYVVRSGDTLSKIAQSFYGDTDKYQLLFDANREVIRDPNLIFPGQKIRVPSEKHAKVKVA